MYHSAERAPSQDVAKRATSNASVAVTSFRSIAVSYTCTTRERCAVKRLKVERRRLPHESAFFGLLTCHQPRLLRRVRHVRSVVEAQVRGCTLRYALRDHHRGDVEHKLVRQISKRGSFHVPRRRAVAVAWRQRLAVSAFVL